MIYRIELPLDTCFYVDGDNIEEFGMLWAITFLHSETNGDYVKTELTYDEYLIETIK